MELFLTIFLEHQEIMKLNKNYRIALCAYSQASRLACEAPKILALCIFTYSSSQPNLETGMKHISSCAGVKMSQPKWN